MYLPEPNPCFLFLRFAMCHWHAKNQHLRFSVRYWGKTSLLVLLYLKAKIHPMALNMILLSFTSKHNCHGSLPKPVLPSHGNHYLPCQVHSLRVTSALWLFHQPTPASKETCIPKVPSSILLSLLFLPPHPIQTSEKTLYSKSSHSTGTLSTNLFQKIAGLTLRALHFKARYLTLDF